MSVNALWLRMPTLGALEDGATHNAVGDATTDGPTPLYTTLASHWPTDLFQPHPAQPEPAPVAADELQGAEAVARVEKGLRILQGRARHAAPAPELQLDTEPDPEPVPDEQPAVEAEPEEPPGAVEPDDASDPDTPTRIMAVVPKELPNRWDTWPSTGMERREGPYPPFEDDDQLRAA